MKFGGWGLKKQFLKASKPSTMKFTIFGETDIKMNTNTPDNPELNSQSKEPAAIVLTNQAKTLITLFTTMTSLIVAIVSFVKILGIGEEVVQSKASLDLLQIEIQKTTAALNKQQLEFNKKNYTLELFRYFQTMKPKLKSDPEMSKEFLALFNEIVADDSSQYFLLDAIKNYVQDRDIEADLAFRSDQIQRSISVTTEAPQISQDKSKLFDIDIFYYLETEGSKAKADAISMLFGKNYNVRVRPFSKLTNLSKSGYRLTKNQIRFNRQDPLELETKNQVAQLLRKNRFSFEEKEVSMKTPYYLSIFVME